MTDRQVRTRGGVAAHIDEVAIPEGLVEYLQAKFPITNPKPDASLVEIHRAAGFQDCIKTLAAMRHRQLKQAEKNRHS